MAIRGDESNLPGSSLATRASMIKTMQAGTMTATNNYKEHVSFWRSLGVSAMCWAAFGLIQGRLVFMNDRNQAIYLPYAHYVVWVGIESFSWTVITPFIFLFARHFPFKKKRWFARSCQYTLLTLAVLTVHPALSAPAWLYKPDQHQTFLRTLMSEGSKQGFGAIQVCLTLYFLAAYQNTRREARARELREAELESRVSTAELHMLRMQLHPHFLFNVLQAATVLIHEDPIAAENILQRLSELLRVALDDLRSLQVPLEQEMAFLDHYVQIQKQRFGERLTVRFDTAPDTLPIPVPTLFLQPLVENAIHHGIGTHKGCDQIEIDARLNGRNLVLEIRNFASSLTQHDPANGHGVGLKNTRARLEQMYGDRATLELASLQPRGVRTTVILPLENL